MLIWYLCLTKIRKCIDQNIMLKKWIWIEKLDVFKIWVELEFQHENLKLYLFFTLYIYYVIYKIIKLNIKYYNINIKNMLFLKFNERKNIFVPKDKRKISN